MAESSGSAEKKTYRGHHCCVYGCSNRQGRENCKFFKVIRNDNPSQTEDWIRKIGRKNEDGSQWRPKPYTLICGEHFISGNMSTEPNNPDYVPSKNFDPAQMIQQKTEEDLARFHRVITLIMSSVAHGFGRLEF